MTNIKVVDNKKQKVKVEHSNIDEGTSKQVTEEIKKEIENGPKQ